MDLSTYIRELILLNECIILPGFGGFETHYSAASFDAVKKQMVPPTKQIEFKPDYKKGGEVLEKHLKKHLRISLEEARKLVIDYVARIQSHLQTSGEFVIQGVGKFKQDPSNNVIFLPFSEENYLADSYGLGAIDNISTSISKETPKADKFILPVSPEFHKNTMTYIIAGMIIIASLITLTVFFSAKFDIYLFNLGDPDDGNEMLIIGSTSDTLNYIVDIDQELRENTSVKNALSYSEQQVNQSKTAGEKRFLLVVGSFKHFNNANELKQNLLEDGFNPEIIDADGNYRVSIGNFSDKDAALIELRRIRQQISRSVWLLTVNN